MFRARALTTSLLIVALFTVSCGGDGSVVSNPEGGNSDFPKVIRMIESTTNFTEDDVKSIGWIAQKDFLLDYPGATTAKWGFLNAAEVGVLIYSSADDAKTLGVAAAEAQTFHNELGEAARRRYYGPNFMPKCRLAICGPGNQQQLLESISIISTA
jgi:hypothetical protein